ncbi:MAG: GDSL-type esterase/lipase family protein [Ruthenibacterium sp.]
MGDFVQAMKDGEMMADRRRLSAQEMRARQAKRLRKQRIRFFALSAVVLLLLAGVITAVIELPGKLAASSLSAAESAASGETAPPTSGDAAAPETVGTFGPVMPETLTYQKPSVSLLSLPENGRVDMAYFSDALFIGDSLTQGFQVYASGIQNAKYAAYLGVGPKQLMSGTVTNLNGDVVAAIDEILAAAPKKVYLLLGTNALSSLEDDALIKYYSDFMDFLMPQLPADTVYYVQAIPPVTAEKSADPQYANTRIAALNENLAQLAYNHNMHFLNLYAALADGENNLRGELVAGSDGVHLNAAGYETWKEFLVTHTAYSKTSPYIAGSPYMTA